MVGDDLGVDGRLLNDFPQWPSSVALKGVLVLLLLISLRSHQQTYSSLFVSWWRQSYLGVEI